MYELIQNFPKFPARKISILQELSALRCRGLRTSAFQKFRKEQRSHLFQTAYQALSDIYYLYILLREFISYYLNVVFEYFSIQFNSLITTIIVTLLTAAFSAVIISLSKHKKFAWLHNLY